MTVIFQLFCVEDLKLLGQSGREELLKLIRHELGTPDTLRFSNDKPQNQSPFVLAITNKTELDLKGPKGQPVRATSNSVPPEIRDMLRKRVDEVSQQLEAPMTRDPADTPELKLSEALLPQFTALRNSRTLKSTDKEEILQWALSCEVNHFNFYYPLLRIRQVVYEWFRTLTGQRPIGPDSPYSPFNREHPLYKYFENL